MPTFTNKTYTSVDIGNSTVTLEEGRVDECLFNDYTLIINTQQDKLILYRKGRSNLELQVNNMYFLTSSQKTIVRNAMAKVKSLFPAYHYYGFSDDFDVNFDPWKWQLTFTYSADAYMIGNIDYFSGTAGYARLNLSHTKIFEMQKIALALAIVILMVALLAILMLTNGAAAPAVVPALSAALSLV